MKMTNPSEAQDFGTQFLEASKTIIPWIVGGFGFTQAINKIFKYFSDSRDAELKEIVKTQVKPDLDRLREENAEIQKSVWELTKKVEELLRR